MLVWNSARAHELYSEGLLNTRILREGCQLWEQLDGQHIVCYIQNICIYIYTNILYTYFLYTIEIMEPQECFIRLRIYHIFTYISTMHPVSKPSPPQDVPRSLDLGEVGNSSVKAGTRASGQTPHTYLTSHSCDSEMDGNG